MTATTEEVWEAFRGRLYDYIRARSRSPELKHTHPNPGGSPSCEDRSGDLRCVNPIAVRLGHSSPMGARRSKVPTLTGFLATDPPSRSPTIPPIPVS